MRKRVSEMENIPVGFIDLREALNVIFPEFHKERFEVKFNFVVGLNLARLRSNQDVNYRGYEKYWILSESTFREFKVRRATFKKMNEKYPMFLCVDESYSYELGVAQKWIPTPQYIQVYKLAAEMNADKKHMWLDGGRRRCSRIIERPLADYENTCVINYKRLESTFTDMYNDMDNLDPSVVAACVNLLAEFSPDGKSTQLYRRINEGRLFNMNRGNIQSVHGFIRDDIFHGAWRYDAENAHYTLATRYTNHDAIHWYANDAASVRSVIAEDLGLSQKEVKAGLLMLLYGVGTSTSNADSPMVKKIGVERARAFFAHKDVQWMMKGIKRLGIDLKHHHEAIPEKTTGQQIAYWLNKLEGEMLDIAVGMCPDVQGLYFDGLISRSRMDVDALNAQTILKLGVPIKWKEDRVGYTEW